MLSSLEHIDFLYGFIDECANLIKKNYTIMIIMLV